MEEFESLRNMVCDEALDEIVEHSDFEEAFDALIAREQNKKGDETFWKHASDKLKLLFVIEKYEFTIGDGDVLVVDDSEVWMDGEWVAIEDL